MLLTTDSRGKQASNKGPFGKSALHIQRQTHSHPLQLHQIAGGCNDRAIRGISAISAPITDTTADPDYPLSANFLGSRCTLQRQYCTNCEKCEL